MSILIRKWTILDKKKKKGFIRTVPPCHFKLGAFVFPWLEELGGRQMRPRDGHPESLCHRWTCAGKPSEPFPFFCFLSKIVHLLDEIDRHVCQRNPGALKAGHTSGGLPPPSCATREIPKASTFTFFSFCSKSTIYSLKSTTHVTVDALISSGQFSGRSPLL